MSRRLVAIISLCVAFAACMHKADMPAGSLDPGPVVMDTGICFERDILPVFIANCARAGCHDAASAQDGYVFTDYNTITRKGIEKGNARESKVYKVLVEDDAKDRMPLSSPPLSPALIDLITRWINEGAKNGTGCKSACDTMTFTYKDAIVPLTTLYCRGCHSTAAPSAGIALDTYEEVRSIAASGRLLGAVQHRSGFVPMPQGGSKLNDCQTRQIEKWIEAGMPDN